MPRDDPDDDGGIERRGLLRGLGLGALGITGTSAMADGVAAQDRKIASTGGTQTQAGELISFAAFTPPGEDVEDDSVEVFTNGLRGNPTGDLVFSLELGIERSVPLGYQLTIVDRSDNNVVPMTFEEGSSRAFSGIVKSDSAGFARKRERFSAEGLGPESPVERPNHYWAVLTVVDYSGLAVNDAENQYQMDCIRVPFTVCHWMQNP